MMKTDAHGQERLVTATTPAQRSDETTRQVAPDDVSSVSSVSNETLDIALDHLDREVQRIEDERRQQLQAQRKQMANRD